MADPTWGSYSSEKMTKVWTIDNNYTGLELFCVRVYWKYRSAINTNQTEIYVTKIRFEETTFKCLGGQSVTLEAGWSNNKASGTIALAQNFGPPYYVDLTVNKSKIFDNDSDGYATGLYFQWRASVTGSDWRRPTFSSLQTYSIPSSTIPKLNLVSDFTLSKTSCEMGSSFDISISASSSSYKHKVTYSFERAAGTIDSASTTGSRTVTYTPPTSLAQQITTTTSGTMTVTVETLSGSTSIGTKSKTITLTVPSTVKATITGITVSEAYSMPSNISVYVQGYSQLRVKVSTSTSNAQGATVKTIYVSYDGVTYYGSDITTTTCKIYGTRTISVKILDSRGREHTSSTTIYVYEYVKPTISDFFAERCTSLGTAYDEGTCAAINFMFTITSLNNQNSKSVTVQYLNSATWTELANFTDYYSAGPRVITQSVFDVDTAYSLRIVASDSLASTIFVMELPASFALINWHKDGKALAFGKKSTGLGIEFGLKAYDKYTTEIIGYRSYYSDNFSLTVGSFLEAIDTLSNKMVGTYAGYIDVMMVIPSAWSPVPGTPIWAQGLVHRYNLISASSDVSYLLYCYDKEGRSYLGIVKRGTVEDPFGSDASVEWIHLYGLEKVYPVGAIYLSMDSTNPSSFFGFGTWSQISGQVASGVYIWKRTA